MTNQLTTLAALPSGSGAKSALPAEVGRAPELIPFFELKIAANPDDVRAIEAAQPSKLAITMNFTIGDVASASMVKQALAASAARVKDSRESGQKWIDRLKESLASQVPINDEYVAPLWSQKAISTDKLDEETLARIERIRKSLGWY